MSEKASEPQATQGGQENFVSLHAYARHKNLDPRIVIKAVEGKVLLVKFLEGGNGLPMVRPIDVDRLLGR